MNRPRSRRRRYRGRRPGHPQAQPGDPNQVQQLGPDGLPMEGVEPLEGMDTMAGEGVDGDHEPSSENGEGNPVVVPAGASIVAPVADAGPLSLEDRCVRQFPRVALGRGRAYFSSGRVSDPVWNGSECVVETRGAGGTYRVTFDFSQVAEGRKLPAKCDCPAYSSGVLCKHLWASILQIDKASAPGLIPQSGTLKLVHEAPRPRGERGQRGILLKADSTSWIERLNRLQGISPMQAGRVFSAANASASFVIQASDTSTMGKLVMDLWTRNRFPNGSLGPLRPNRVHGKELSQFAETKDQEVLSLLNRSCDPQTFSPYGRGGGNVTSRFTVDPIFESHLIPSLASSGKLLLSRSPNGSPDNAERPLRIDPRNWELELKVEVASAEQYRLEGFFRRGGEMKSLSAPIAILRSGYLIFDDKIGKLAETGQANWAIHLRTTELLVPKAEGDALLTRLLLDPGSPKVNWPSEMGWAQEIIDPRPVGVFKPLNDDPTLGRMTLTVSFDYRGRIIPLADTEKTLVDVASKKVFPRNVEFEERTLLKALEILRDPSGTGTVKSSDLHRAAHELCAAGWSIHFENQQLRIADDFSMNVSSSTDWFDLKVEASFGDLAVDQSELMAALASNSGLVRLKDGTLGMLPPDWVAKYAPLAQLGARFGATSEDGSFRFTKSQGLMLNAVLPDDPRMKADSAFMNFREKIRRFDGVEKREAPSGFHGKLRDYQREGLTWLGFLEEFETGGILADDMGLGKTIQILAYLLDRAKKSAAGGKKLPNLVVTPKSLAFNWIDEASKFVPELKLIRYTGTGRSQKLEDLNKADVVITTYGTLRTDVAKLNEIEFDVAIVDEAQAIKNSKSQSAMATKRIRANQRIALTGTPIENSIKDLLSILEYTNPGLLPPQQEVTGETQNLLAKTLKPFMLRRTKEKVLTELPDKSEQVLYCEMSPVEKQFYNSIRDKYRASLTEKIEKGGIGKSKLHVLEALLRLRQAACHAGLIDPNFQGEPSAKLQLLINHVREVTAEGHKALIFSQFTSLLALVKTQLEEEGIVYEYLDGQTHDRKTPVERFQNDPKVPVFLISLKAGGTGLNLTAADYVFILDPWWNPAVEAQAIGRAHRMGQQSKVFAYRMIARGTVEEKILDLQKTKRELAESIISEDQDFLKNLTRDDLEQLLG